jgi:hypothetical protein
MISAHPLLEMRRLLSNLRDNLRKPQISNSRWQHSHIDNLIEKLFPLWTECGIEMPAFYIAQDADPEYRIRLGVTFKSIEYRDPDDCESASIFLEVTTEEAGERVVATVGELADVADVVDRWIGWIDARTVEIIDSKLSVRENCKSLPAQSETLEQVGKELSKCEGSQLLKDCLIPLQAVDKKRETDETSILSKTSMPARKKGGRPRKTELTKVEAAVQRFVKANPTMALCDVDKALSAKYCLKASDTAKILERIERWERRNRKRADNTGQN